MRRVYRVKNHDAIELKFAILETLAADIPETHAGQNRVMEGEYLSSSIFRIRKHASKVLRLLT